MGVLANSIDAYNVTKAEKLSPETLQTMDQATLDLKATGIEDRALKVGQRMPDFELPNQHGESRRLTDLLGGSALVLNVYRGGWCPYCNLEMEALHDALPEIEARGARLVGLTPESPEKASDTAMRHDIAIDILSDAGNLVAQRLGLVFELPEALRSLYISFGIDLPAYNGDDSFCLPVPATYIIGHDGIVIFAFVNADYTRRLEPTEIITQLDSLANAG